MKRILIAVTALTLSFGTAYAAHFGGETELYSELADWHGAATAPHHAAYTGASLSEVVDGYWATLSTLGYSGTVTALTPTATTYSFDGAAGTLTATFGQTDEAITVTLSRPSPETFS